MHAGAIAYALLCSFSAILLAVCLVRIEIFAGYMYIDSLCIWCKSSCSKTADITRSVL